MCKWQNGHRQSVRCGELIMKIKYILVRPVPLNPHDPAGLVNTTTSILVPEFMNDFINHQ